MQKVINRSSYAKKYAARKLAKQKIYDDKAYMRKDHLEQAVTNRKVKATYKTQQQQRWDSIYRGNLAPRHDAGAMAEQYGTVNSDRARNARVSDRRRVTCPFAVDDRVVVVGTQYRDCGKIGKVIEIDDETQSVKVEDVELANLHSEKYMRALMQTDATFTTAPLPIPFKDVRLVYPLVHPETGVLRDVIINEIELREPSWQEKRAGIEKSIRSIAGLLPLVELPYPEEQEPEHANTNADTLRIEVEERTWVPTLGVPPMPPNIIDELRNKYSVFRTRYDDEFIARKDAIAQRALDKSKALKAAAKTSLNEVNLANRDKMRQINATASEGGAWAPLSPAIIEGIARLGLESEARIGRKLPAVARDQFALIRDGFKDDPIAEVVVEPVSEELVEKDMLAMEDELDDKARP